MKDIRTLATALLLAAISTGGLAASGTATINDVKVVVANLDADNPSAPSYGSEVNFSDAQADVDGIVVQLVDEQFGFMTPVSQSSLPVLPDANGSAFIAGTTLSAYAFASGSGSTDGAASTGSGSFILPARTTLTLSATLLLSSDGRGAIAMDSFCLVTCVEYSVVGGAQTYTLERSVSNTTDDFESFFDFLVTEVVVVPVPELSPLLQMLAGLAALAAVGRAGTGGGQRRTKADSGARSSL